jgi:hypothetical protein
MSCFLVVLYEVRKNAFEDCVHPFVRLWTIGWAGGHVAGMWVFRWDVLQEEERLEKLGIWKDNISMDLKVVDCTHMMQDSWLLWLSERQCTRQQFCLEFGGHFSPQKLSVVTEILRNCSHSRPRQLLSYYFNLPQILPISLLSSHYTAFNLITRHYSIHGS